MRNKNISRKQVLVNRTGNELEHICHDGIVWSRRDGARVFAAMNTACADERSGFAPIEL